MKLTADVGPVSDMAGNGTRFFQGIFDGQEYTLTFNKGESGSPYTNEYCAPFRSALGATFQNLKVDGTIYTSNKKAAGIVAEIGHNDTNSEPTAGCTFTNCVSNINIISSRNGDGSHGGLVGIIQKGTNNFNGWAFISSPIGTVNPENVAYMTDNTFDIYRFNQNPSVTTIDGEEKYLEWENWKKPDEGDGGINHYNFDLEPGRGYLYANSENVTLTFIGVPYNGSGEVPLTYSTDNPDTKMHGWNLIGNPFVVTASLPSGLSYYILNEEGSELAAGTATTIEAMEAIFVKATGLGESITFTKQSRNTEGNANAFLALNLSNNGNGLIDRAIVRFDESQTLPKFMLNKSHTKIYIPQHGKDYAVVNTENEGETPVNFRANENGTYTLTVSLEGMEMNYLHLIDNMTGTEVDLLCNPSYSFEANTTDYESRFKLVFFTDENGPSTGSETFAFYSNGNWIINNANEATLQVIDLNGRILSSETINGSASKAINATPGVYMLRLINGENVKVQKIVVR